MDSMLILALALLVLGLVVTVVEIFLPSGGLLSLVAVACFVGCLYCAYKVSGTALGVIAVVQVICIPTIIAVGFKILPKTSFGKQLILSRRAEQADGSSNRTQQTATTHEERWNTLMDREGVAVTPLRPSGTAEINDRRVSVVTEGSHIRSGTRVRVVKVEGNRVVVDAIDEPGDSATT